MTGVSAAEKGSERGSTGHWLGRWLAFSLMFFGLPLGLAWIGAEQVWKQREKDRRRELEKRLDDLVSSFEEQVDPANQISRLLRQVERMVFSPSVATGEAGQQALLKRRSRILQMLKNRYPGLFEVTVLDGDGVPIRELCDVPPPRNMLKKLFNACRESRIGDARAFSRETAVIKSFLGPMLSPDVFIARQILFANSIGKRRLVYISEVHPDGMMVVHLSPGRNWRLLTLREHLERQRKRPGVKLALVDLVRPTREAFRSWKAPKANLPKFFHRFLAHTLDSSWKGDFLWMRRTLATDLVLVARADIGRDAAGRFQRRLVAGGLIGGWALLAAVAALIAMGRIAWDWSVRTSLVLAFIYTAGLPILVMGLTARSYLQERRDLLERYCQDEAERALIAYDAGFPSFLESFGVGMGVLVRDIRMEDSAGTASFTPILAHLAKKLAEYDYCEVVNGSGVRVVTEMSRQAVGNAADLTAAVSALSMRMLKVLHPLKRRTVSHLLEEQGQTDWLFTRLIGNIGQVVPMDIGNSPCLLGQFLLYDRSDCPTFIATLFWSKIKLERDFLRSGLLEAGRRLDDTILFAFNRDRPEWSVPVRTPLQSTFREFVPQVLSAERGTRRRVVMADGVRLLTGIRGTMLPSYSLAAATSDRRIRHEIAQLSWRLFMAGWVVLAISVVIGMTVARAFLAPIRTLEEGVLALKERRFQARLEVATTDEFGRLTESFNEMMEGLADLQLAKVIQESLFPGDQIQVGEMTVYGACRPASEVGGDYFEYGVIDGTSVAIVLGDVSGHGVSAALVMAMARAVFAHPGSGKDPARGLAAMNSVLLATLKRKKMMTCLYGIVDLTQRRFSFANAGQCYPILVRAGKPRLLELPGKPLGTGQKRTFEISTIDLESGDWLVFSTDGLFEALTTRGQQLGYEGVLEALPGLAAPTARECTQKIRDWHSTAVAAGPQEDDITVIVCRLGEGVSG